MGRKPKAEEAWEVPASVYIMSAGGRIKIGLASDVAKRQKQMQNGSPARVELLAHRQFGTRLSAKDVEGRLHRKFSRRRLWGEWFSGDPASMIKALEAITDPELHIDSWVPGMPPEIAQAEILVRWQWCRDNDIVYGAKRRA